MNRREAVKRLVRLDPETTVSLAEVSAQLAVHCETNPHEFQNGRTCSWCGKPKGEK